MYIGGCMFPILCSKSNPFFRFSHRETQNRVRNFTTSPTHIRSVNKALVTMEATQSERYFEVTQQHFNNYFNSIYRHHPSVVPTINFLNSKGITNIQNIFSDHFALRAPNIPTGIQMCEGLIGSGTYTYAPKLKSNGPENVKSAIHETQIAGGRQVAVTLCATNKAIAAGLPHFCFLSMRVEDQPEENLFQGLKLPFKPLAINDPYWAPAKELSDQYGAISPNHFAISINQLIKDSHFKSIKDFRSQILQMPGCEENPSLSVVNCPDVEQYALKGHQLYVEMIQREFYLPGSDKQFKKTEYVPGFSTQTENINRIGGHIGHALSGNIIDDFKLNCASVAVQLAKESAEQWDDELKTTLEPYNAEIEEVENPIIYAHAKTEADIRSIITWVKKNKGIIIPMGGNTNLVQASTFQSVPDINHDQPIIYLKYVNKSITYHQ